MPWTFAHPAAILPLLRWTPARLNLAGLTIGALTPDFGYYIHAPVFATLAHTAAGSLLACLPAGIGLLIVFYALRRPLWYLLPQPHRDLLEPASSSPVPQRPAQIAAALVSLLIGAWTHIIWDASSHVRGWIVTQVSLLRATAFTLNGQIVPVYKVVQHSSTLLGILCLLVAYRSWLRRQGAATILSFDAADRWRYGLLVIAMLVAVLVGSVMASAVATTREAFVFRAAVQIVVVFVPLLSVAALICHLRRVRL